MLAANGAANIDDRRLNAACKRSVDGAFGYQMMRPFGSSV
jgi:hypothetical protein